METTMKKTILTLAALAALTSAVMAHPMHAARVNDAMRGADAQAMSPAYAGTVTAFGRNLGSDPDPQVRLQLLRSAGNLDR